MSIVDLSKEKRVPVNTMSDMKIPTLGEAICNVDDDELRDKLLQSFIKIARENLKEYNETIQIYEYIILTGRKKHGHIPKLIIHVEVENIKDFKSILKNLREYFHIQGGLRLSVFGNFYINDDGEIKYFDDGENELNLILRLHRV